MAKLKGLDVIVSVNAGTIAIPDWKAVGGQRNATLNRSAELIDMTDKDSDGWKENEAGYKEWSLDCDGFYVTSDAGWTALETAYETGEVVQVKLAKTAGLTHTGSAIISDFPIEVPYDDGATYSISLTGTSELT